MLKMPRGILFLSALVFISMSLTGCEKIAQIKEYYFGSPKTDVSEPAAMTPSSAATTSSPSTDANVLASVGNWTMTQDEFKQRLDSLKEVVPDYNVDDPQARRVLLDEIIRQELLIQDAEKTGMANQKDIVDAVNEFRRTLIVREAARQLTEGIKVTEEEAKKFYEDNKEALVEPLQLHVREIVVNSQESANNILIELLKGVDFAEMAKQYSTSKTASKGGDLGFIDQVPFPQMGSALLSLEEGGVSSVFRGPDGYYIVKVEEKKGGEQIPFDEIKEDIFQNQILAKQQEAILKRLDELEKEIPVTVNEDLLK